MNKKLAWIEGDPKNAGVAGFVWVADEDGNFAVVEIDADGHYSKPRHLGKIVVWSGPIEPPDESTLP